MAISLIVVLVILASGAFFFVTGWIRADLVGVLMMLGLLLSGVLSVEEALAGFSSSTVMIIGAMFIVSNGIVNTGIAQRLGSLVLKIGASSEKRIIALLMGSIGGIGAFMSSTAAIAIFLPITLSVSRKANLNRKRLLMPLSAAALISGMMTLVATTPNLIVSSALEERQLAPFDFFSFTPYGIVILMIAVAFMIFYATEKLSPTKHTYQVDKKPTMRDLLKKYDLIKNFARLRIQPNSPLIDRAVARMGLREKFNVELIGFEKQRSGRMLFESASAESVFRNADALYVSGTADTIDKLKEEMSLSSLPLPRAEDILEISQKLGMAEIMLVPESKLIGKKLKESLFKTKYNFTVIGIRRHGKPINLQQGDVKLGFGDVLLINAAWANIQNLTSQSKEFLVLTLPEEIDDILPPIHKTVVACILLVLMVVIMALGIVPPVTAVLLAAVSLIATKCVDLKSIYREIDWQTIVLVATILPMATALHKTGGADMMSHSLVSLFSSLPIYTMLIFLFLVTSVMGLFVSNSATAVIVAPIAIDTALALGVSPHAFAMIVAIACSAAYVMPVSSPVNMLVQEPGGYKAMDFIKIGVPLQLLTMIITVIMVWLIYF